MSTPPTAAATTESAAPDPARATRGRRVLVWALIVAASVIAVISTLTTWVDRQMLDEDAWRKASAELIEDPQVQKALAVFLVDEAYDKADVAGALEQRAPPLLKPLVPTAAAALREPATGAVERLLAAGRVQEAFVAASVIAQRKLINVLEDKTGYGISTGDGVVTLDLRELVTVVAGELGVPAPSLSRLPPDAGVVTVARSSELAAAQQGLKVLKVLSVALLVLVLVLYVAAILLAQGERRRALRNVGWAIILVGLVILATRRIGGQYAIDALATPATRAASERVWTIGTSILSQIGWAAVFYGVLLMFGAILAGPTRAATAVRRRLAPVLNDRAGIAWATVAFLFVLLVIWGPTHALRTAWGLALIAALIAGGVVALRRQTLAEFPTRPTPLESKEA